MTLGDGGFFKRVHYVHELVTRVKTYRGSESSRIQTGTRRRRYHLGRLYELERESNFAEGRATFEARVPAARTNVEL